MRLRPPTADEAPAVLDVLIARDVADLGRPDYTLEDLVGDWEMPSTDLSRDALVAEDRGAIVGYAFADARGAAVHVHPQAEGRGIGTALREAIERRLTERGQPLLQMVVSSNAAAIEHVQAAGYVRRRVYRRLSAPLATVPAPDGGARVRRFDLSAEGRAMHALIEDALGEIEGSIPEPFDDWQSWVQRHTDPAYLLALDDEEGVAAAAVGAAWPNGIGYVAQLGTVARARGRGHGRALLLALAATFRGAGLETMELSVHGANAPALGLYERIGMRTAFSAERWERLP